MSSLFVIPEVIISPESSEQLSNDCYGIGGTTDIGCGFLIPDFRGRLRDVL